MKAFRSPLQSIKRVTHKQIQLKENQIVELTFHRQQRELHRHELQIQHDQLQQSLVALFPTPEAIQMLTSGQLELARLEDQIQQLTDEIHHLHGLERHHLTEYHQLTARLSGLTSVIEQHLRTYRRQVLQDSQHALDQQTASR